MSLAIVYSCGSTRIDPPPVTVEVHISNGMPVFSVVGLTGNCCLRKAVIAFVVPLSGYILLIITLYKRIQMRDLLETLLEEAFIVTSEARKGTLR